MKQAKWKRVWFRQVQSITLKSNTKSDFMVQILSRTGEAKSKEKSGEEIKDTIPQKEKFINFHNGYF
jgi:hypothetical protein